MDRKKQRKDQQLKQSLKTLLQIQPHLLSNNSNTNLLQKLYPQIAELNSLRILTILEIIYLLEIYLDFIQKNSPSFLSQFKIGIIGFGITSRMILNSILSFQKDGLVLRNITVSTRQTDNLKFYVDNFGINAVFDNQTTARQSDFLIIATPSTLDNWIILDLKESLNIRLKCAQKNNSSALSNYTSINNTKLINQKFQKTGIKAIAEERRNKSPNNQKANTIIIPKPQLNKKLFNPLVYILTSDFDVQKCKRIFPFPVLTPSIRMNHLKVLKQKLNLSETQEPNLQKHQKLLSQWLQTKQQQKRSNLQSRQSTDFQISTQNELLQNYNKYINTPFSRIINMFAFIYNNTNSQSIVSSYTNTVSISQTAMRQKYRQESLIEVLEILIQDGQFQSKLYKKIKKWQMGHHNYIS